MAYTVINFLGQSFSILQQLVISQEDVNLPKQCETCPQLLIINEKDKERFS